MKTGIYGIHNKQTDKWYIGQSFNITKRFGAHKRALKRGDHHNEHLQRSFKINGTDSFEYIILEETDISQLDAREVEWIAKLKSSSDASGYNLEEGGNFNKITSLDTRNKISRLHKGRKLSDEHRRKLSLAAKNKPKSKEHRQSLSLALKGKPIPWQDKMIKALRDKPMTQKQFEAHSKCGSVNFLGKTHSPESRLKISLANKGKKATAETLLKMSLSQKGKILTAEHRHKISIANKGNGKGSQRPKEIKLQISEGLRKYHELRRCSLVGRNAQKENS
jgi:group I intron endonuclease